MTLDDALFNWLQIKYVAEQQPEDEPAQETYAFFTTILEEDHRLQDIQVQEKDAMYVIRFKQDDTEHSKRFPIEFVRQLYHDLNGLNDGSGCTK